MSGKCALADSLCECSVLPVIELAETLVPVLAPHSYYVVETGAVAESVVKGKYPSFYLSGKLVSLLLSALLFLIY